MAKWESYYDRNSNTLKYTSNIDLKTTYDIKISEEEIQKLIDLGMPVKIVNNFNAYRIKRLLRKTSLKRITITTTAIGLFALLSNATMTNLDEIQKLREAGVSNFISYQVGALKINYTDPKLYDVAYHIPIILNDKYKWLSLKEKDSSRFVVERNENEKFTSDDKIKEAITLISFTNNIIEEYEDSLNSYGSKIIDTLNKKTRILALSTKGELFKYIDDRINDLRGTLTKLLPHLTESSGGKIKEIPNQSTILRAYYDYSLNSYFIDKEHIFSSSHEEIHNLSRHGDYVGFRNKIKNIGYAINEGMTVYLELDVVNPTIANKTAYYEYNYIKMLLSFIPEEVLVKIFFEGTTEDLENSLKKYGDKEKFLIYMMDKDHGIYRNSLNIKRYITNMFKNYIIENNIDIDSKEGMEMLSKFAEALFAGPNNSNKTLENEAELQQMLNIVVEAMENNIEMKK